MTTYNHVHSYVRMRKVPTIVLWLAFRLGLQRFVLETGDLPHNAECTPGEDGGVVLGPSANTWDR